MLPTRTTGRLGLPVTVLGLGGAPLGDLYDRLDEVTALATVTEAYDAGVRLFDTSPHYGQGLSEHRFGTALRQVPRDSFVVSTKVGRVMDPRGGAGATAVTGKDAIAPGFAGGLPHRARFDYSYDGAMRSFEQSLLRLGLDRIDVLLIHDVDVWTHGSEAIEDRFREAMEGAYRALHRLRQEGAVAAIGCGLNDAAMCERFARAGDFDVMMLAGRYTLLEQGALDDFLPVALEKRIAVLLAGVFNSGILATGPRAGAHYNYASAAPEVLDRATRLERVCGAHGVALAEAALQFPLAHPAIVALVVGATRPEEVRRNIEALSRPIPASLWSDLKAEGLLAPHAPAPA
jgi:D-threo-aldose 1-dehydrogenase